MCSSDALSLSLSLLKQTSSRRVVRPVTSSSQAGDHGMRGLAAPSLAAARPGSRRGWRWGREECRPSGRPGFLVTGAPVPSGVTSLLYGVGVAFLIPVLGARAVLVSAGVPLFSRRSCAWSAARLGHFGVRCGRLKTQPFPRLFMAKAHITGPLAQGSFVLGFLSGWKVCF